MRPRSLVLGTTALAMAAILMLVGTADTVHAGTFNPELAVAVDDPSAGVHSGYTIDFNLPDGDVNFAGVVSFIPKEWEIVPGDQIPVGAIIGKLSSQATLGLINGACNNVLPVEFTMHNSSIDIADTIAFEEEAGGPDPLRQDWAEDLDGNEILEAVEKYPEFITRVLTDDNDQPLQPFRRSAGVTIVAGVDVLLQLLIFEPGTFINKLIPDDPELGYPSVTLLQNIGDPEVDPEPGTITDFCTPLLSTNVGFGESDACEGVVDDDEDGEVNDGCPAAGTAESEVVLEDGSDPCANNVDDDQNDDLDAIPTLGAFERVVNDGCPPEGETSEGDIRHALFTNPTQAGTYTFTTVAVGQRDGDGDGFENNLDVCPFIVNEGSPRILGDGDADTDGLDSACEPNDNETNSDQDLDGFTNRQDNCPLIANGQNEADIPGVGNQEDSDVDTDGDDAPDQIGDACDTEPDTPNGELSVATLTQDVTITGEAPPEETPQDGDGTTPVEGEEDGGGLSTGALIGIIIGVIAGVIVLGGAAFFVLRRGGGGGATA